MRSSILVGAVLATLAVCAIAAPISPSTISSLYAPRYGWLGSCYQQAAYKDNDALPVYCIPGAAPGNTIINEYSIRYSEPYQQRFQAFGARENITANGNLYFLLPELFPPAGKASSNFTFVNNTDGYISTNNGTFVYQACYYVDITGTGDQAKMFEYGEYFLRNYSGTFACPSSAEITAKTLRCDAVSGRFTYYCELTPYVPSPEDASTASKLLVTGLSVVALALAALLF